MYCLLLKLFGPDLTINQPTSKDPSTAFPLNRVDLATVSVEELITISKAAPIIYRLQGTHVVRLSTHLVLKSGQAIQMQEIKAMKYVNSNMDVPTSRLHRYFFTAFDRSTSYPCGYMVMDYVEGDTVFDIWESLDTERRTDVVKEGADIVSQLQLHSFDQPGPLGGGRCRRFRVSGYGAGPFHKDDFNAWFTRKLEFSQRRGYASKDFPHFDYSSFTLVHHDICPVNLILDRDSNVWVIDWATREPIPPFSKRRR